MAGRRAADGGWEIGPPDDPLIMNEIMAKLAALPAKTQVALWSELESRSSANLIFKERVAEFDRFHEVYILPPTGRPPCWVVAVNGFTSHPVVADLCLKRPRPVRAVRLARRALGLDESRD